MNVLIIEDEKNLAQALCRIMEEEKWQATAVYNAKTVYNMPHNTHMTLSLWISCFLD